MSIIFFIDYVEAIKLKPVTGRQNIKLDVWTITAVNQSNTPKCITIHWKLMDFDLETQLPYEFLILDHEELKIGKMKQTIWSFDDGGNCLHQVMLIV